MDSHALSSERDLFIHCTNNRWRSLTLPLRSTYCNTGSWFEFFYSNKSLLLFIKYYGSFHCIDTRITIEAFIILKIYIYRKLDLNPDPLIQILQFYSPETGILLKVEFNSQPWKKITGLLNECWVFSWSLISSFLCLVHRTDL